MLVPASPVPSDPALNHTGSSAHPWSRDCPGATWIPRLHLSLSPFSHACCVLREHRGSTKISPGDQSMSHPVPDRPALLQGTEEGMGLSGHGAQQGHRVTTGPQLGSARGFCPASGDRDTLGCRSLASQAVSGTTGRAQPSLACRDTWPQSCWKAAPWGHRDGSCTRGSAGAPTAAAAGRAVLAGSTGAVRAVATQHAASSCVCLAGTACHRHWVRVASCW